MANDPRSAPHTHHLRVQRTARYYTLGGGSGVLRTFWFVLHGYGQLAGDFIRYFGILANDESIVVAPEAMNRFYLVSPESAPARERPVGATWMTREDRDSEIADYVEYLDALFDDVALEAVRDGARVNIIGFSQGAATATRWVEHGRVPAHRLILWGGTMPPETDLSHGHRALRGVPITFVVGSRDHYIDDEVLAAEQARLEKAGVPFDSIRFDGGHAISRSVFPQLVGSG